MAADILVYSATQLTVGQDQKQHLELSRDIAQKFNNDFSASIQAHGFGDTFFPQPEPIIQGPATRVMSLRDGSKKMSKSEASDYSRINLTDDADAISKKIKKAKTINAVTDLMLHADTQKVLTALPEGIRDEIRDFAKARLVELGWPTKKAAA